MKLYKRLSEVDETEQYIFLFTTIVLNKVSHHGSSHWKPSQTNESFKKVITYAYNKLNLQRNARKVCTLSIIELTFNC